MKRLYLLIFLFLSGCGINEISETENSDISVNISENTEIEVDEVSENVVSENDNINQSQTGSFNLPVFNGECIYSEADALQELQTLREDNNLDFDIKYYLSDRSSRMCRQGMGCKSSTGSNNR